MCPAVSPRVRRPQTPADVRKAIQEALEFHLEGLAEDGKKAPRPTSEAEYIAV